MKPKTVKPKRVKKTVLKLLYQKSPRTRQELIDGIVENHEGVSEKQLERAIYKMTKMKKIQESSNGLFTFGVGYKPESNNNEHGKKKKGGVSNKEGKESGKKGAASSKVVAEVIPAAEMIRRRAAARQAPGEQGSQTKQHGDDKIDIDKEIKRLEAELAAEDDESEDESDGAEDESLEGGDRKVSFGADTVVEIESSKKVAPDDTPAVLCLSSVADERIQPLPASCLPQNKKRKLKGVDEREEEAPQPKKRVGSGLQEAVQEVLSGYVARSAERLPFYCRVCAKQYSNEKEFFDHKGTDFHKTAAEMERKMSFCKLCHKQFTSPVQLQEHLSSRPHRERLAQMRSRNPSRQNHGRHNQAGEGPSRRQWC